MFPEEQTRVVGRLQDICFSKIMTPGCMKLPSMKPASSAILLRRTCRNYIISSCFRIVQNSVTLSVRLDVTDLLFFGFLFLSPHYVYCSACIHNLFELGGGAILSFASGSKTSWTSPVLILFLSKQSMSGKQGLFLVFHSWFAKPWFIYIYMV